MVRPWDIGDFKLGAEIGRGKFGDQFFGSVGVVAEARSVLASQTMFRSTPMRELVQPRGFVGLGWRRSIGADEQITRRHLDEVAIAVRRSVPVEGALSAFTKF